MEQQDPEYDPERAAELYDLWLNEGSRGLAEKPYCVEWARRWEISVMLMADIALAALAQRTELVVALARQARVMTTDVSEFLLAQPELDGADGACLRRTRASVAA